MGTSTPIPQPRSTSQRFKEQMAIQGFFVVASPLEQFAEYERKEIARWAKVVKDSGVKPQ